MSRESGWKLKPGEEKKRVLGGRFLVTTITEVVCETEGVGPAPKKNGGSISAGFEPIRKETREYPSGFLVHRLNHSANNRSLFEKTLRKNVIKVIESLM